MYKLKKIFKCDTVLKNGFIHLDVGQIIGSNAHYGISNEGTKDINEAFMALEKYDRGALNVGQEKCDCIAQVVEV